MDIIHFLIKEQNNEVDMSSLQEHLRKKGKKIPHKDFANFKICGRKIVPEVGILLTIILFWSQRKLASHEKDRI